MMGTAILVYTAPIMTMGAFLFMVRSSQIRRKKMRTEKEEYRAQGQPIVVRAENSEELHKFIRVLVEKYDFSGKRALTEGGVTSDIGGCCPWIFANVEGRSFRIGRAGICFAKPVFNRWLTIENFLTILNIVYGSDKIDKTLP